MQKVIKFTFKSIKCLIKSIKNKIKVKSSKNHVKSIYDLNLPAQTYHYTNIKELPKKQN